MNENDLEHTLSSFWTDIKWCLFFRFIRHFQCRYFDCNNKIQSFEKVWLSSNSFFFHLVLLHSRCDVYQIWATQLDLLTTRRLRSFYSCLLCKKHLDTPESRRVKHQKRIINQSILEYHLKLPFMAFVSAQEHFWLSRLIMNCFLP